MKTLHKYNSIIESYRTEEINEWLIYNPQLRDALYVATEKIDGACFGEIFYRDGSTEYTSRREALGDDSDFFGCKSILNNYEPYRIIRKYLIGMTQKLDQDIILYGEMHGKHVFDRIKYDRGIKFFDIYHSREQKYLPFFELEQIFKYFHIEDSLTPVVYRDVRGLDAALALNNRFQSLLTPSDFNGENLAEGIVIRPYTIDVSFVDRLSTMRRFTIKSKRPEFSQKKPSSSPEKKNIKVPDELVKYAEIIFDYVNENRLDSVISKLGPLTDPNRIGPYLKEFNLDCREAFMRDHGEEYNRLEATYGKTDAKHIFDAAYNEIRNMVIKRAEDNSSRLKI
jgi:Rnl2 family RNA ligase